ncbi:MAG TPA: PHP-associated domain-containing protein, partial [Methylomirabilota bacterium]|nr:PHP-associated domain-containing protein [Methylomirabilota bacterium]
MPLLRSNLHAHTTWSDGVRSPERLVHEYEALGYDFLAITDHWDHENMVAQDYARALDALTSDMVLFPGVELEHIRLSQHVGKVVGDREALFVLNHPARYRLSVEQTIERIGIIRAAGMPIEAVELTDTGLYRPVYDTEEIPVVKIATDDAHRPPHFGRAWIEVEAPRERDAILRAVRAGDFRVGFADRAP